MTNGTMTGGCACGAVRYEITGEPVMAGHCQCRDCQRMTGTLKYHRSTADSGSTVARGFCPECGSFISGTSSAMPQLTTVAAASLDDPSQFHPQLVVYTCSAQPWDRMDPALPQFERMPPMGG